MYKRQFQAFATPEETEALRAEFAAGVAWGRAKEILFERIDREIAPMRARYQHLVANPAEVEQILQAGAAQARARTVPFMAQLRHAVGLRNLADLDTGAGAAKTAKTTQTVYKQFRESDGKFYVRMVHADGTEQLSQGFADPREAGQFVAAQKKIETS